MRLCPSPADTIALFLARRLYSYTTLRRRQTRASASRTKRRRRMWSPYLGQRVRYKLLPRCYWYVETPSASGRNTDLHSCRTTYLSKPIWQSPPVPTCHAYAVPPIVLRSSNVSSASPKYPLWPMSNHLRPMAEDLVSNHFLNIPSSSGVNEATVISSLLHGKCWSNSYSITTYMSILRPLRILTKGAIRLRKRSPTLTVKFCQLPGFVVSLCAYRITALLTYQPQTLRNWSEPIERAIGGSDWPILRQT
jgi:hypothetical protein